MALLPTKTVSLPTPTKSTAKTINGLKAGETVNLQFHGSKRFGNDPYQDEHVFVGFEGEGDDKRAVFEGGFEAYRYNGRWSYGTSAEKLSVAK
jgi:hypothetical protein